MKNKIRKARESKARVKEMHKSAFQNKQAYNWARSLPKPKKEIADATGDSKKHDEQDPTV